MSEILDFEGSFKPAGKEATKGRDKGGERCKDQNMELDWGDDDGVGEGEEFAERVD